MQILVKLINTNIRIKILKGFCYINGYKIKKIYNENKNKYQKMFNEHGKGGKLQLATQILNNNFKLNEKMGNNKLKQKGITKEN